MWEQICPTEQKDGRAEGQWKMMKLIVAPNFEILLVNDEYPYNQKDWNYILNIWKYAHVFISSEWPSGSPWIHLIFKINDNFLKLSFHVSILVYPCIVGLSSNFKPRKWRQDFKTKRLYLSNKLNYTCIIDA